MTVYEGRLLCVHPLCHRWPDARKELRTFVSAHSPEEATEAAKENFASSDRRRCRECHRPIALRHLEMWNTDGNGNATDKVMVTT